MSVEVDYLNQVRRKANIDALRRDTDDLDVLVGILKSGSLPINRIRTILRFVQHTQRKIDIRLKLV